MSAPRNQQSVPKQIQCGARAKFNVAKRLGSGGFADVYLVESLSSGRKYACKFISKKSVEGKKVYAEKVKLELKLHAKCGKDFFLENRYVVEFGRYWDDQQYIYILMNYCPNGSLAGWLQKRKTLTEIETRYIIKEITLAVKYLHEVHHVIHRDLKLANILLDKNMNIKLCDFGLAAEITDEQYKKYTMCGTPNYCAPEIASCIVKNPNKGHSFGVDIWAIGVMTYTLLFGVPPFQAKNIANTCARIHKGIFKFPNNPKISNTGKDFMNRILTVDVEKRLIIKQILKHNFLQGLPKQLPDVCLQRAATEPELFPYGVNNEIDMEKKFNKNSENIVKFVDFSKQYGIGYILSNGFTGVIFNDNSSIILPINKKFIFFIDASNKGTKYEYKQFANNEIDNKSLMKRFNAFISIAKIIWKKFKLNHDVITQTSKGLEVKDIIYLEQWKRTKYAMVFKFNNKTIQTLFKDQTNVVLKSNEDGSTAVTFLKQSKDIFKQYPSYRTFKDSATKEMKSYLEHIQLAILNKENDES